MNAAIKASDSTPLALDVNEDGYADYSFFARLVSMPEATHLYAGVKPIGTNAAKMSAPVADRFLGMAEVTAVTNGRIISHTLLPAKQWGTEFGYLAVRHTSTQGNDIFEGLWGNENSEIMPLRIGINGSLYYGWAKLVFDRDAEQLTLVEYAWNRNSGQEIKAGIF